ncbi:MAG: zinc-ribbon domain-containing protein [Nitrospirae bacterium]|nr:zinc-ribbon domain-containing protein [Nitrospirota bacterium]
MVVACPRCNKKLRIDEEKLRFRNVLFQCIKCSNIFVPKKQRILQNKTSSNGKILIAHSNPFIVNKIVRLLKNNGYSPIASHDGIDAIIKAIKEHPFLTIIEADLPKINGFKVYKRLKLTCEAKDIKFLFLVTSDSNNKNDFFTYKDNCNFIKEYQISSLLIEKIDLLEKEDGL